MDHRFKCKTSNQKTFSKNIGENIWDQGLGKEFVDCPLKA